MMWMGQRIPWEGRRLLRGIEGYCRALPRHLWLDRSLPYTLQCCSAGPSILFGNTLEHLESSDGDVTTSQLLASTLLFVSPSTTIQYPCFTLLSLGEGVLWTRGTLCFNGDHILFIRAFYFLRNSYNVYILIHLLSPLSLSISAVVLEFQHLLFACK